MRYIEPMREIWANFLIFFIFLDAAVLSYIGSNLLYIIKEIFSSGLVRYHLWFNEILSKGGGRVVSNNIYNFIFTYLI